MLQLKNYTWRWWVDNCVHNVLHIVVIDCIDCCWIIIHNVVCCLSVARVVVDNLCITDPCSESILLKLALPHSLFRWKYQEQQREIEALSPGIDTHKIQRMIFHTSLNPAYVKWKQMFLMVLRSLALLSLAIWYNWDEIPCWVTRPPPATFWEFKLPPVPGADPMDWTTTGAEAGKGGNPDGWTMVTVFWMITVTAMKLPGQWQTVLVRLIDQIKNVEGNCLHDEED